MDSTLLINGLLLDFSIATPVGPIGVICIHRTISEGRLAGLVSGLRAASADAIYGSVAGFGITFISNFLVSQQLLFKFLGGIFLIFLGIKTFRAKPGSLTNENPITGNSSSYLTTFLLPLINLMTIISFTAIFFGLGLVYTSTNYSTALLLIIGVFLGSALWWIFLSAIVGSFRSKLNITSMGWINKFSGSIILCFGVFALSGLFQ